MHGRIQNILDMDLQMDFIRASVATKKDYP
jgi:hypothetical protein